MIVDADYQILIQYRDREFHELTHPVDSRILDLDRRGFLELQTKVERGCDARGINYQKSIRVAIITIAGLDALTTSEEVAHDKAKNEKEKRSDRKFQVILASISFLLGLIVEYFSQIVGAAVTLFRTLHS